MTTLTPAARILRGAGIVLALAVMRTASAADEATLLDETGSGIVPVNTETRLRVRAVAGQVLIRLGDQGELQFQSTSIEKAGEEIPVALWTDGGMFRVEPTRGQATVKTRLSLAIPAGMRVRLELEDAAVSAGSLDNELAVHGRQIQFDATGLLQSAEFEIEGGAVNVRSSAKGVTIRGRDLDVVLEGVSGQTTLVLSGGTAKLTDLLSGLQGDFTGTRVAIDTILGAVNLRFLKGTAQITGLRNGGELALTGCPLRMAQVGGEIAVASDSEVLFNDCKASLHIENSGGAVTGQKNDGVLEVRTHNTTVALSNIQGQLRVAGDDLDVKLEHIGATLGVFTKSSSVSIEGAETAVTVENDQGDVTIKRAVGEVNLKTQRGDVYLLEMRGPVTVDAAGAHVEVEWSALPAGKDSHIDNDGGDVTVRFPGAGACRVEAKSKFGRVDSNLSKVRVPEDGGSAQGLVGNGGQKAVFIEASGDVHLLGAEAPEPSGQEP